MIESTQGKESELTETLKQNPKQKNRHCGSHKLGGFVLLALLARLNPTIKHLDLNSGDGDSKLATEHRLGYGNSFQGILRCF